MIRAMKTAFLLAVCPLMTASLALSGEFTPAGKVTWVVSTKPGSNIDIFSRTVGEAIKSLKPAYNLVMLNKEDGAGAVANRDVSIMRAGNDANNTLLTFNIGDVPSLLQNTEMRIKDFTPLAVLAQDKHIFYTGSGSRFKSFQDFADALQKEPLVLAGGRGDDIMFFESVKRSVDRNGNLTYLQTDGTNDTAVQVLGGHVEVGMGKQAVLNAFIGNGDFVPLAVEGNERLGGIYADVPTFKELGYPDIGFIQFRAVFGSRNMTPEARDYWSDVLLKAAQSDYFTKNYIQKFSSELALMDAAETKAYFEKAEKDAVAAGYGK
jgi:putative tricarboxylic transport membrane protein